MRLPSYFVFGIALVLMFLFLAGSLFVFNAFNKPKPLTKISEAAMLDEYLAGIIQSDYLPGQADADQTTVLNMMGKNVSYRYKTWVTDAGERAYAFLSDSNDYELHLKLNQSFAIGELPAREASASALLKKYFKGTYVPICRDEPGYNEPGYVVCEYFVKGKTVENGAGVLLQPETMKLTYPLNATILKVFNDLKKPYRSRMTSTGVLITGASDENASAELIKTLRGYLAFKDYSINTTIKGILIQNKTFVPSKNMTASLFSCRHLKGSELFGTGSCIQGVNEK